MAPLFAGSVSGVKSSALCLRPAPKNEDEMMVAIFEYIDRIFNIVRPRRLLYMAIDGVVSMGTFSFQLDSPHLPSVRRVTEWLVLEGTLKFPMVPHGQGYLAPAQVAPSNLAISRSDEKSPLSITCSPKQLSEQERLSRCPG